MADSPRLLRGFSYASAIPNHSKQGNPMHVLGESVSFGRFMSEPLSWEKWSAFSNKKYVEEAARFAQPGSVAAKAAFFEAHYKRIAAQKALALLEQESAAAAAKADSEEAVLDYTADDDDDTNAVILNSEFDGANDSKESSVAVVNGNEGKGEKNSVTFSENIDSASCSEGSGTPQMEKPLLKNSVNSEEISSATSKKKSGFSSLKSSIQRKTWKVPNTPAKPVTPQLKNVTQSTKKSAVDSVDKKKSTPKSLHGLIKLIPIKAPEKEPISAIEKDTNSKTTRDCKTPMRTPMVAAIKSAVKYPTSTPRSENKRMKTPIDPSTTGSKSSGPKWHILSSVCSKSLTACRKKLQSPTSSITPFILRTEERAAKRKQKLEEKFNTNEANKVQTQKTLKEKAGKEIRKLSCGFCFKARPLPKFYKEREMLINQTKKNQATQLQTAVLGRIVSSKKQGSTAPKPLATKINGISKNPSRKNVVKPSKKSFTTTYDRITHENKSPNIQH